MASDARSALSVSQQDQLEQQIGSEPIYIVVAASGSNGYDAAMDQLINDLSSHEQFVVGFYDVRTDHFGAYNRGVLADNEAAQLATTAVQDHQNDPAAALTEFVSSVKSKAGSASSTGSGSSSSGAWIAIVIVIGVLLIAGLLVGLLIIRPRRARRARDLKDAKAAAQDDLLALNQQITDRGQRRRHPASTPTRRPSRRRRWPPTSGAPPPWTRRAAPGHGCWSAGTSPRPSTGWPAAEALAHGQPRPDRRPSCFFDPRHGMSVADVAWTPPDGGPTREVPVCANDLHKIERGVEPEMRTVRQTGSQTPVYYANAGFAPAYWGGYGYGPDLFTGFLLGSALSGGWGGGYGWGGPGWGGPGWDGGPGYGDGNGGEFGGGDFGGGDNFGGGGGDFGGGDNFSGGDFGGGDFGGGDFGGGDFGGGDDFGN